MAASIELKTGIPRSLTLSQDRTRVLRARLHVREDRDRRHRDAQRRSTLHAEQRQQADAHHAACRPIRSNRFLILLTRTATKQIDRWEIGRPRSTSLRPRQQKKITRTIPWPQAARSARPSTSGSRPTASSSTSSATTSLILETEKFTEVETWPLSRRSEAGLGRINFGPVTTSTTTPGFFTGLFTMQDPVQNRRIMGIGRVNLVARRDRLHADRSGRAAWASRMAPDRKRAYGIDAARSAATSSGPSTSSTQEAGQPPRSSRAGRAWRCACQSNGKVLYVFQAGATIDVYDAATYK